jgi:hypothetical protein
MYYEAAQVLHRAVELGIISEDDIYFSTDENVWHTLCSSNDAHIQEGIAHIINPRRGFITVTEYENYDLHFKERFRGVNPLVIDPSSGDRMPLSSIDAHFASYFNCVKELVSQGCYIKRTTPQPHA